jgi:hypothetical protein
VQTNHIGMSLRFLESASYWTGVFAVGLTAAAAVAGVLTWYFSSKLSNAKDAAFDRFKEESKPPLHQQMKKRLKQTKLLPKPMNARLFLTRKRQRHAWSLQRLTQLTFQ